MASCLFFTRDGQDLNRIAAFNRGRMVNHFGCALLFDLLGRVYYAQSVIFIVLIWCQARDVLGFLRYVVVVAFDRSQVALHFIDPAYLGERNIASIDIIDLDRLL